MARQDPDVVTEQRPGVMYCVNHPNRETLLRCSRCLDPICTQCAMRAPVGLRCPKCARLNRSPLYALQPQHYALALLAALPLGLIGGAVAAQLGLLFTFFLAAPAGALIGEAVLRITHGKRGRPMQLTTAGCIAMGALLGPWLWAAARVGSLAALPHTPLAYFATLLNIGTILYAVLGIGAAVARLR